jgi:hypothetical protein
VIRRTVLVVGVVFAVLGATAIALLPPAALLATTGNVPRTWPVVRGAYHVHSQRSDGTGTLDEISAAAARAGLQFVIVTDHGDGTRPPEPPAYRSGVLCIDAVEISTQYGHYVAMDLPQTPYRLAGHPRDVIEDVRRFGGFGFAAHPDSPKAALQWDAWTAPFDGIEWLNADSEWRDEFWGSLGGVLLTYAIRPVETLGGLLDRPTNVLTQWDRLAATRRVAAIAGADAHARLGFRQAADPYEDRVLARLPSYEVSFRAFSNHVILSNALSGEPLTDAALITAAVRDGRIFTSIDSFAALGAFEAKALTGNTVARPGEYLQVQRAAAIEAAIAAPAGTTLAVLRNGQMLYETRAAALRIDVGAEPGAYRIEARLPSQSASSVPWVLTNPIYIGLAERHAAAAATSASPPASTRERIATEAWQAEASPGSTSELRATALPDGTPAVEWQFSLEGGARGGQYAAMRFPVTAGVVDYDRLQLRVQSDGPRRVWAQLRAPGAQEGERWGKSFYVGPDLETIELRFSEFLPVGLVSTERPPLAGIDSLLLVVDTLNSAPGSAGRMAITDLWFAR